MKPSVEPRAKEMAKRLHQVAGATFNKEISNISQYVRAHFYNRCTNLVQMRSNIVLVQSHLRKNCWNLRDQPRSQPRRMLTMTSPTSRAGHNMLARYFWLATLLSSSAMAADLRVGLACRSRRPRPRPGHFGCRSRRFCSPLRQAGRHYRRRKIPAATGHRVVVVSGQSHPDHEAYGSTSYSKTASPSTPTAVKVNLDRYRTDPLSKRKTELKPVASVDVVDPLTVSIKLNTGLCAAGQRACPTAPA